MTYHSELTDIEYKRTQRSQRYYLQNIARELLPDERVATCLRAVAQYGISSTGAILPRAPEFVVITRDDRNHCRYRNLFTCSSVWHCPICAYRIASRREELLTDMLAASGLYGTMATYTLWHNSDSPLTMLLKIINDAHRCMTALRAYKALKDKGLIGYVRSLEITYGQDTGWHPHIHSLLIWDSVPCIEKIHADICGMWVQRVKECGGYAHPDAFDLAGTNLTKLAGYVCKGLASEVTLSTTKQAGSGRYTMLQLLEQSKIHNWARRAFRHYAESVKGRRQLVYSNGLKKRLTYDEVSDSELATEYDTSEATLALITKRGWQAVIAHDARASVLCQAEKHGYSGVVSALMGIAPEFIGDMESLVQEPIPQGFGS